MVKSKGRFAYPLDFYFHLQEEERVKRKRSRQERCESCTYCVITPSEEKSGYCELKEYAVEMWWQACKDYITREEITTRLSDFLDEKEEEEDRGDHYSFWRGCNLPRLWDRSWGPFGPRRRR